MNYNIKPFVVVQHTYLQEATSVVRTDKHVKIPESMHANRIAVRVEHFAFGDAMAVSAVSYKGPVVTVRRIRHGRSTYRWDGTMVGQELTKNIG